MSPKRGMLVVGFLAFGHALASAQGSDDCQALRTMIDSARKDFVDLKGSRQPDDDRGQVYLAKIRLSFMPKCLVEDRRDFGLLMECFSPPSSVRRTTPLGVTISFVESCHLPVVDREHSGWMHSKKSTIFEIGPKQRAPHVGVVASDFYPNLSLLGIYAMTPPDRDTSDRDPSEPSLRHRSH